jgi:6,7-dimethyl-8-ribityllumazine synthase
VKTLEGTLQVPKGARFGIVASRFNNFIVDRLVEGAHDVLVRHGADDGLITRVLVPGSWELPLATQKLAASNDYDAIIAVGCLIRGATPHFDYISAEVSKGLAAVSMDSGVPVSFGVLTTDTIEQAVERAGTKAGNKGAEAAMAAIELVSLYARISSGS